jgi:hypothetical protein
MKNDSPDRGLARNGLMPWSCGKTAFQRGGLSGFAGATFPGVPSARHELLKLL